MNKIRIGWLATLAVLPALALAHTHLEKSVPAANSTFAAMPAEILLQFSEATRVTALSIETADGQVKQVLAPGVESKKQLQLAAPRLGAGAYVLTWRGLSADGHVMSGTVKFTVTGK